MSDANPLENALAWFASAPERWRSDAEAVAEWVWVVLQGDFADNPTTAQTITGGLISMIPLVDQLSDLRDLVANVRALREDEHDAMRWLALALTLIGLFPTLGSPVKAGLKLVVAEARREVYRAAKLGRRGLRTVEKDGLWKATSGAVERGLARLGAFCTSPPMRKALAAQRVDKVFHYLATELRALAAGLDATKLRAACEHALEALEDMLRRLHFWGGAVIQRPVGELIDTLQWVHGRLDSGLKTVTEPLSYWLECVARRLEVDGDMQFRAMVNARNPHGTPRPATRITPDRELEIVAENRPSWVSLVHRLPNPALSKPPVPPPGHFDLESRLGNVEQPFTSFSGFARPDVLRPGTRLIRIVDPSSWDNSPFWMLESEFQKLQSKADWRARFAVWRQWNGNGEYVVYEVPPGSGAQAWRGPTASQVLPGESEKALVANGQFHCLPGGAEQIVLRPQDLDPAFLSKRMKTGWTYADSVSDDRASPVGVPALTNFWGPDKQ